METSVLGLVNRLHGLDLSGTLRRINVQRDSVASAARMYGSISVRLVCQEKGT